MFDFIMKCPNCGHLMRVIDESDWHCANCDTAAYRENDEVVYKSPNDISECE